MKQILLLDYHYQLAAPAALATVHDHIRDLLCFNLKDVDLAPCLSTS